MPGRFAGSPASTAEMSASKSDVSGPIRLIDLATRDQAFASSGVRRRFDMGPV